MNKLAVVLGVVLGAIIGYTSPTWASRNDAGTYSLPAGNPVVANTKITASWGNTTLGDVRTELTNSLDRNGRGAMLAPLQLSNGTCAAPSLTFGSQAGMGVYRAGTSDMRVCMATNEIQKWTTTGTTITGTETVSNGIIVTKSSSGIGLTSTGNGGASGITAYGGEIDGTGMTSTGGGGAGKGVIAIGGASTDGGVSGIGAYGTGGGTNGIGIYGIGGSSTGSGGQFSGGASSGIGVVGTGGGTGYGVYGTGGALAVGGYFSHGTAATASVRKDAVALGNGDLSLNGVANPNSNIAMLNRLTPANIIKAWGKLTTGASPSIDDGFNIASISCTSNIIRVNYAQAMGGTTYASMVNFWNSTGAGDKSLMTCTEATGYLEICEYTAAGVGVDLCSVTQHVTFMVVGAQ